MFLACWQNQSGIYVRLEIRSLLPLSQGLKSSLVVVSLVGLVLHALCRRYSKCDRIHYTSRQDISAALHCMINAKVPAWILELSLHCFMTGKKACTVGTQAKSMLIWNCMLTSLYTTGKSLSEASQLLKPALTFTTLSKKEVSNKMATKISWV